MPKFYRFGHMDKVFVRLNQKIKKGDLLGTIGDGNGQYKNQGHCHFDISTKELKPWTSYVFGMSLEQVKELYADPAPYRKIVLPSFDHFGWEYLELATYGKKKCFHPGEDLNGPGVGNADVGNGVFSACDGEVVYCYNDSGSNGGWGKLLVVKEFDNNITTKNKYDNYKYGLDCSHHQSKIDWDKVDQDFIYLKCTQGTGFLDPKYKEYKNKVREKGIRLGHYHFAGKGFEDENGKIYFVAQDPIEEADWFLKNADFKPEDDLILDWEIQFSNPVAWCFRFLERVYEKTGKRCYIYLNESTVLKYNWTAVSDYYPLWIAKYYVDENKKQTGMIGNPKTGTWKDWSIYQYTSEGKVPGIKDGKKDYVDLNVMKASEHTDTVPIDAPQSTTNVLNEELEQLPNDYTQGNSEKVVIAEDENKWNKLLNYILNLIKIILKK